METLDRINELRQERGWSINYLAMEAELTQSTINNLFVRRSEPKLSTLRAICKAFGITLSDFFAEPASPDDELIIKVKGLSADNKAALLQLLKNIK